MTRADWRRKWRELTQELMSLEGISTEGRRRVLIRGCKNLVDYTPDRVAVRLGSGVIRVEGQALTLRAFRGDSILVEGVWHVVKWEDEV